MKINHRKTGPSLHTGLLEVEAALEFGGALYGKPSLVDFNAAFDNIVSLLEDAVALFVRNSFSTSAFLAITAIEETAKAHVAIFRQDRPQGRSKGRDPIRNHKRKHRMAILPSVFMSGQLSETLGSEVCLRLQREAESDGFVETREAALYCGFHHGRFTTPRSAISSARARELLLLSFETLRDGLIGYSDHTLIAGVRINVLFDQIAAVKPSEQIDQ